MFHVRINKNLYEFSEGITILDALREIKIDVPALCHDERLKPCGSCRMCLVEVKGYSYPLTACEHYLTDGMEIETQTAELENERHALLRMLASRLPVEMLKQSPEKDFQRHARHYNLSEADFLGETNTKLIDDSHPYIHVDMSRCVDCYRCVRICEELQGQFVWKVFNRGNATQIHPDGDTLKESSCVSCGACVDTCPSGALEDKSILLNGKPETFTRTTCPYCGTGCEMYVGARENHIVAIRPVLDAPVNKGHLCVKGRYAFDFVHAQDRVTEPMIRCGNEWQKVSWDEAVSFVAKSLKRIIEEYGNDSVGVLGSARATNEENYLAQKFSRVVLRTNNVDCCARVCHAPTAAAMKMTLGTGAATNSFDDIEHAQTILVAGANATENHPIIGARIKQAALRGANLIVIDPCRIELADYAKIHLALKPGTNVLLLNAIAHTIVEENLFDETFISNRVDEWKEFQNFIEKFSPEKVADACGIEANLIREAARLYATAKPSMCIHGLGMTEHTQGTDGVMCLVNLALLTGNIGKRGTGINPLRGQNNVQGSAQMGCEPSNLTGMISIKDGRELFERVWQTDIPTSQGLNLMQMMDEAREGTLKALWAIGYDIFLTNPNAHTTKEALQSLKLLIVQDMFMNETAREFAHVFLPAVSSFEKDGTFMNAERRVQRIRKAIEPIGSAKSDWEIICSIAKAMDKEEFFDFSSPEEIWNEVRAVWKPSNGITYERLEHGGLQWACPTQDHAGTEILHAQTFTHGERAALRRIEYKPTQETLSDEFPFLLTTGRTLYQFNAGTMTVRTNNAMFRPTDLLCISPTDALRLNLEDGERARVISRYGEAVLPIDINDAMKTGELFATFHTPEVFLNYITSPHRDSYVQAPEYKVTAVRIEKLCFARN
jgi:formate dehydrogenase major subunit